MREDIRYALRILLKHRAVTAVALLTLIVGTAVNTAAFGICNAVWFRPAPFRDYDRLVVLHEAQHSTGASRISPQAALREE